MKFLLVAAYALSFCAIATDVTSSELILDALKSNDIVKRLNESPRAAVFVKVLARVPDYHRHQCLRAADAGKHVYVQMENEENGLSYTEFFMSTSGDTKTLVFCGQRN